MAGYNSCMFAYGQVQTKVLCSGPLKPSPRSFQYLENPQSFRAGQILEFLETLLSSVACSEFLLQTGSGKTHTMLGDIEDLENKPSDNRGMTPRVFEYLFARIRRVIICSWICCLHCICFVVPCDIHSHGGGTATVTICSLSHVLCKCRKRKSERWRT